MRPNPVQQGFSLVELAVVLVIVSLLAGGLIFGLSAQREAAALQDARRQLETVKEALLGFAMANGRLPCPAPANLPNTDASAGKAPAPPCNNALQYGVVPWLTLGLPETDPWGQRLTYFASSKFSAAPVASAQAGFTMDTGLDSPPLPISDTAGLANIRNFPDSATVAIDLAAVVVSHGARGNGAYLPDGSQIASVAGRELENSNATQDFVADTPTPAFDDVLVWISPHLLKSRLVAVGKLP
jgi:prepilin-type N-terminal cleavage/methylation domain-containing protein